MQYSLKELRARKDWSQEQVAKAIGISTQTYNAWERDFGRVKVSKAKQLADLYGVSLEEIFFEG